VSAAELCWAARSIVVCSESNRHCRAVVYTASDGAYPPVRNTVLLAKQLVDSVMRARIRRSVIRSRQAASLYRDDGILLQHRDPRRLRVAVMKPGNRTVIDDPKASRASCSFERPLVQGYDLPAKLDQRIRELELHRVHRAKQHDAQAFQRLRSVPGIGKVLALTILYEVHDVARFERVQNFLSYARLVKCEHSSAGKKLGTGGAKIGNVHLKWAFSEAAVFFLRNNPAGQKHLRRLAGRHGKAKALSILAAKLGRAVDFMLKRGRAFEMQRFLAHS